MKDIVLIACWCADGGAAMASKSSPCVVSLLVHTCRDLHSPRRGSGHLS